MIFGLFGKKKEEVLLGEVIHYFRKVKVAVIEVKKGEVSIGDTIRFRGHSADFKQKIQSMEIDHVAVEKVSKGQEVAIKVRSKTRPGAQVFLLK